MDFTKFQQLEELKILIEKDSDDLITVSGVPIEYIDQLKRELNEYSIFTTSLYSTSLKEYVNSIDCYGMDEITYTPVIRILQKYGFEKVEHFSNKSQFLIKGDIISFWPIYSDYPIRVEFFGDDIEKIELYDHAINKTIKPLKEIIFANENFLEDKNYPVSLNFGNGSIKGSIIEFSTFKDGNIAFDLKSPTLFFGRQDIALEYIDKFEKENYDIKIFSNHPERLIDELKSYSTEFEYPSGVISNQNKILVLTDKELFGSIFLSSEISKSATSSKSRKLLSQFEGEIQIGDYIVHEDHGIGIYRGIIQEKLSMSDDDVSNFIKIEYAEDDELLVPLNMISKITKYFGTGEEPEVTKLSKQNWKALTEKIKASVQIMAYELVRHYAKMAIAKIDSIKISDELEYKRFIENFEYTETPDQERTIHEVINDLESESPMNRLVVGDVGFGKTEVILRASYIAASSGKQVAILAPTTILVRQHEKLFKERFKDFDIKIESVSRFKDKYKNKDVIENLKNGEIDILIGTHRLLSNDIEFKNIGLLVIDEEQKFGVKQKEKLKKLKYGVNVLATSATPIPRTLSMALSTIQDISIIQTPPPGRKAVKTEVEKMNWNGVVDAIRQERVRNGQVFVIYNRVKDIASIANKIKSLLPEIRIEYAHGQMSGDKLEGIMTRFLDQETDVLLSTTIIENGIDMSNVNTLIVIKSQNFGLSQLYQLKGRVGRSSRQAFAYFFYDGIDIKNLNMKDLTEDEKKQLEKNYIRRLKALKETEGLGTGFDIATKDLEIRGAGNLLGREQHGNISKIGYGLYMQLLSQEIEKLKNSSN